MLGNSIEPNEPVEAAEPLMLPLACILPVTSNYSVGLELLIPTFPEESIRTRSPALVPNVK